jgi:phosphate transport system permease protein
MPVRIPHTRRDAATMKRSQSTPWGVKLLDSLASRVIPIGGIGTILSIFLVVFVLLANVLPLFRPSKIEAARTLSLPSGYEQESVAVGCHDSNWMAWVIRSDGTIAVFDTAASRLIKEIPPPADWPATTRIATTANSPDHRSWLVGCTDGTLRFLDLSLEEGFLAQSDPRTEGTQPTATQDDRLVVSTGEGLRRYLTVPTARWSPPLSVGDQPIRQVDLHGSQAAGAGSQDRARQWGVVCGNRLTVGISSTKVNRLTKKTTEQVAMMHQDLGDRMAGEPIAVMMHASGNRVLVASSMGEVISYRWDAISGNDKKELLPEYQLQLSDYGVRAATVAAPLLGRETFLIGDANGAIVGVFEVRETAEQHQGGANRLAAVQRMEAGTAPVRTLACSPTDRVLASWTDAGEGQLSFASTSRQLARFRDSSVPWKHCNFSPKGDAIWMVGANLLTQRPIALAHPEASWQSYFRPVWYEGYPQPRYMWQSSSGSVAAENKLSLIPLIFGTLKATFYTLLVGVPLALMAAVFSSEFMDRRWRRRVKPAIELMASVPSVVLGYVAAMVFAPWLREHLAWMLAILLLIPFNYLLGAHLWGLVQRDIALRSTGYRVVAVLLLLPLSVWQAGWLGHWIEERWFDGNLLRWITEGQSTSQIGWQLISLPMAVVLVGLGSGRMESLLGEGNYWNTAFGRLTRFFVVALLVWLVAGSIGWTLQRGLGPIQPLVFSGGYQERNAILVASLLSFAIVPLIYTLADDALQAVPQQLRSASLGCGATTWQTAWYVVLPTAMSGIFSAVMVGFGRAVGETMVVLMAAGNTPLMDISPFNGYRTLSATLATELPEAARGTTHFRTLFLAALLLFVITLLANSIAEWVRIRYRKRFVQL